MRPLDLLINLVIGSSLIAKKLQIFPNTLRLKSLEYLGLNGCVSLEKFPNIHPETKCEDLYFCDCNIREWPSSLGYLISGLGWLVLYDCLNLGNFLNSIRGCKFTNLRVLQVGNCDGNIIESCILMKSDSFPSLIELYIDGSNIVTIPRSIIDLLHYNNFICAIARSFEKFQGFHGL